MRSASGRIRHDRHAHAIRTGASTALQVSDDDLVDRTIEAVHRISLDLRPSMLDFGIVAAIDWQAREFEKQIGIACVFPAPTRKSTSTRTRRPRCSASSRKR